MALYSMTGFARRDGRHSDDLGETRWTIEVRSVNGRSLDVKCRYPAGYEHLDRLAKELCKVKFQRGQIAVNFQIITDALRAVVTINESMIDFYLRAGDGLIKSGRVEPPRWDGLLSLRGVLETAADDDTVDEGRAFEASLIDDLNNVLEDLKAARGHEGEALLHILNHHLETLTISRHNAEALAGQQLTHIRERFERRLTEIMGDTAEFQDRILQEAAVLGVKADVTEELDRLRAHIEAAHALLGADTSQGRKLDFLAQEFMREANTLCSKSTLTELTAIGLNLKSTIDQFREQIQNVE
ncbi:YicC family protein [Asticcacaulis sp. SL142]|uniref:YicC/YloC family endoribonuclease n=1 Tax=Asticcacaulis sp. SL142 TaxID=2995155 RepID=UPI00226CF90D|nr:YicC/YloC family endoribonuclease [Asticcacaulis sp. SL142]WAC48677.1 YicC family protein [Asticcacaulis sp. SL142]